jgi:transcriptional regulator with XRE-family HTH domain
MAKLLNLRRAYTAVSAYERGIREPDLLVLLRYAKLAKVSTDVLVDDSKDLS